LRKTPLQDRVLLAARRWPRLGFPTLILGTIPE